MERDRNRAFIEVKLHSWIVLLNDSGIILPTLTINEILQQNRSDFIGRIVKESERSVVFNEAISFFDFFVAFSSLPRLTDFEQSFH